MKQYIAFILVITFLLFGACKRQNTEHNHSHNSEQGHNHDDDHKHEEGDNHKHEEGEEAHKHDGDCDHDAEDNSHGDDEEDHNPDEIVFTKAQAEASGLELITATSSNFRQVIKTSGQIISAQGDQVNIVAKNSGVVFFNKSVTEGTYLKSGENFVSISSKNIADGDPVQKALYTYQAAKKEFDRANALIEDKLISEKDYNQIKLNYETAEVSYKAFSSTSSQKGVNVSSPISGYVKSKFVNEGDFVEVGQTIAVISQNKKMQLKAEIAERYYHNLGNIVSANFKTPYNNNVYRISDLNGKLLSFGKSSDQNYFIPINFEFDNINNLVSGSFVEVFLLSKAIENTISIPVSSLIEDQGLYFVFLQLSEEHYKKQEVALGENDGINVRILSGVNAGDKVVSKSAYHVKLASASTEVPHGHTH